MSHTRTFTDSKDGIQRTNVTLNVRLTAREIELLEIIANGENSINKELEVFLSTWVDNLETYAKDFGYIK